MFAQKYKLEILGGAIGFFMGIFACCSFTQTTKLPIKPDWVNEFEERRKQEVLHEEELRKKYEKELEERRKKIAEDSKVELD